jgi:hypothetical protein
MEPTAKELAHAVYRLGTGEPVDDIRFDVWKRLTEMGMVQRGPKGEPRLTAKGESTSQQLKRAFPEWADSSQPT